MVLKKGTFFQICYYVKNPSISTVLLTYMEITEIYLQGQVTDIAAVESLMQAVDRVGYDQVRVDAVYMQPGKMPPQDRIRLKVEKYERWLREYQEGGDSGDAQV